MSKRERYFFLFFIAVVALICMFRDSANAGDWDYYYEPVEVYDVYPTMPGTDMRDWSEPGYRIEIDRYGNEEAYPTFPGTGMRDWSKPGYRIDRR